MPGRNVLVVDDSPTDLQLAVGALAGLGCTIQTAVSGEDCLEKAARWKPTVIVLDVVMAGKNGYQICRELKSADATKEIRVVLLTSKKQPSDKFWGMKQGADAYLTKPFEDQELAKTVSSLL